MCDLIGVVDAFVVTSGRNTRQVRTLVDEIERRVKEGGGRSPSSVEGLRDGTWVLMDYGDFVVHVFLEETRDFYDLEHLWSARPTGGVAGGGHAEAGRRARRGRRRGGCGRCRQRRGTA